MNLNWGKVAKRFAKVAIASGAGFGTCYALNDLAVNPETMIFSAFIPPLISAIGNFLKHKFGIKLPI